MSACPRPVLRSVLAAALLGPAPAALHAQDPGGAAPDPSQARQLATVTVNAQLDLARNQLSPSTGSSLYVFTRQAIAGMPLGTTTPLNQVLLQAPGVVQDSFG